MRILRSEDRGRSRYAWLDSRHSFSFAGYYNPDRMGVSVLRVINDDIVAPGMGFETHSHRNVEIISYILEGAIEHKDSLGNINRLEAGEFQVMTAGTGVTHSEYNPSAKKQLRFLQIWIWPNTRDLTPAYAEKAFPQSGQRQLIVSPDGRAGSLSINQDATLERLKLHAGEHQDVAVNANRNGMLHVIGGAVKTENTTLRAGDAAIVEEPGQLHFAASEDTEALWFDLP